MNLSIYLYIYKYIYSTSLRNKENATQGLSGVEQISSTLLAIQNSTTTVWPTIYTFLEWIYLDSYISQG